MWEDERNQEPGRDQRDRRLDRVAREVAGLRAEMAVVQAAMAALAAEVARDAPDPIEALGRFTAVFQGFAEAAASAVSGIGAAKDVTDAAERFANNAEMLLRQKPLPPAIPG